MVCIGEYKKLQAIAARGFQTWSGKDGYSQGKWLLAMETTFQRHEHNRESWMKIAHSHKNVYLVKEVRKLLSCYPNFPLAGTPVAQISHLSIELWSCYSPQHQEWECIRCRVDDIQSLTYILAVLGVDLEDIVPLHQGRLAGFTDLHNLPDRQHNNKHYKHWRIQRKSHGAKIIIFKD